MSVQRIIVGAVVALTLGLVAQAQAQTSDCSQPNPKYCPSTVTVTPPDEEGVSTVAGQLSTTRTQEITIPASSLPGTTQFKINLTGPGSMVIHAGDQTITVTIDENGVTHIDAGNGPITVDLLTSRRAARAATAGPIEIKITQTGVAYTLEAAGKKLITAGRSTVTVPGAATVTRGAGATTYDVHGTGDCSALLNEAANTFNADSGIACQIRSVGGTDRFKLGDLADSVRAGGGSDVVDANGGRDVVYGGTSEDSLFGGAGRDKLFGGNGDDKVSGGGGADDLTGGNGRDSVSGGAGRDVIYVKGHGLDTVTCGSGHDVVYAGPSDEVAGDCEVVNRG